MHRYLIALALTLACVSAATAATPYQDFKQTRIRIHEAVDRAKQNRCRGHARPFAHRAYQIPWQRRAGVLHFWRVRRAFARSQKTLCSVAVIRRVFPAATEGAALSVAYCETGGTYSRYATNASSGAAGLFQLMPFHWQGKFDPYNPWANASYAYRLSSAGYDWSAWVCSP